MAGIVASNARDTITGHNSIGLNRLRGIARSAIAKYFQSGRSCAIDHVVQHRQLGYKNVTSTTIQTQYHSYIHVWSQCGSVCTREVVDNVVFELYCTKTCPL